VAQHPRGRIADAEANRAGRLGLRFSRGYQERQRGTGGSGTPTFFAGDTTGIPPNNPAEHTKYFAYPQTHLLSSSQASYDKNTGVITLHIPLSDVGSPSYGTRHYSATAFTATSATPQSAATLFSLTDATTPFELVIGTPGTVGSAPQKITGSGASAGTNTFPSITGGSNGRVDVAYYHASETSEQGTCASGSGTCTLHGAGSFRNAEWTVQMGQSLDANSSSPSYSTADVSEGPVKHGQIYQLTPGNIGPGKPSR
jgi:hypothetical protein